MGLGMPNIYNVSSSSNNLKVSGNNQSLPIASSPGTGNQMLPGAGFLGGITSFSGVIILIVFSGILLHLMRGERKIEQLVLNWLYVAVTATAGVSLYKVIFLRWNIPVFSDLAHFV